MHICMSYSYTVYSMLQWQFPLCGELNILKRYLLSFFFFFGTKVLNQVHIVENIPGRSKQSPQSVVCVEIGLFHGCKAQAQQPQTSGLLDDVSAKMHPRQAASHQVNDLLSVSTPWQTSGHLQLQQTACQCFIIMFACCKQDSFSCL